MASETRDGCGLRVAAALVIAALLGLPAPASAGGSIKAGDLPNPDTGATLGPPRAGSSTGDAAKAGGDDPALLAAAVPGSLSSVGLDNKTIQALENKFFWDLGNGKSREEITNDLIDTWAHSGGDGSNTTTAPASRSGSSVASSGPMTTTTAAPTLPPLQASTDTPGEAAAWQKVSDAHDAAIQAQIDMLTAQDLKTDIYFAYKYDHLTPEQSAAIRSGGYEQFMEGMDKTIASLAQKVDQAWQNYTVALNNARAVARQARGGP